MLSEFACAYGARPSVMDQDDEDSQVHVSPWICICTEPIEFS